MKRLLLSTAAMVIGAGAAQSAEPVIYTPPVVDSTMYADEMPAFLYFSAEALLLARSSTDTELWQHEVTLDFTSTRDIDDMGFGAGVRLQAGGALFDGFGWQVGGFWAGSFSSSGTSTTDPDEDIDAIYDDDVTPGNLDFQNSDTAYAMTMTETSSVGGFEASATYDMGPVRFLLGPRWIRYQASLGTVVYDDISSFTGLDTNIDRVHISSTNDLFGLQAGIEGMFSLTDMISVGGRAAVGIYANHATLDRRYSADNGSSPFATQSVSDSSSDTALAQSFEVSPRVELAVTENTSISLGAMFLMLNGVDEPGEHYTEIGADDLSGDLAADSPDLTNGVHFAGLTLGVHGEF